MFEWFFKWWDTFLQSALWQAFLSHFSWVDWIAFLALFLGVIYGLKNGFLAEVSEIFEICVVIAAVGFSFPRFQLFLAQHVKSIPAETLPSVAYITAAIGLWFAIGLTFRVLRKFFHTETAAPIRLIGGGILGGIHLLIIFSFFSQAILLMPARELKLGYDKSNSFTGSAMARLAPTIQNVLLEPFKDTKI